MNQTPTSTGRRNPIQSFLPNQFSSRRSSTISSSSTNSPSSSQGSNLNRFFPSKDPQSWNRFGNEKSKTYEIPNNNNNVIGNRSKFFGSGADPSNHPSSSSSSSSVIFGSKRESAGSGSESVSKVDVLERPRDRTRYEEVSNSSLAFLFSEIVKYTQDRVSGISDLERRLSLLGYHVGSRLLNLTLHRQEMSNNPKQPKREVRLLPTLIWIHGTFWKSIFGKQADSLERSTEAGRGDEYMISTNNPTFSGSISVPKEMSQLSVEAFTAGIVEAALDGLGFPARVTAHTVPTQEHPNRTTILIKLDKSVMEREESFGS
ncbi:hypothetical protein IE53DRAFT_386451 [Violaceomyces palustris]|uniref:Uncharacterized protein n=1 Tax=Violaceomyces palustris TaxID=1673888 RepID=A0ACD0NZC0_9BASI|nr:hypothetical protein IE53DRAFT_386451 [Violaceomyces palustris]